MKPIVVLGGSGMLGIGVMSALRDAGVHHFSYSTRSGEPVAGFENFTHFKFDASLGESGVVSDYAQDGYVINCIGVIKPHIKDDSAPERRNAMLINGLFPDELDQAAKNSGFKVMRASLYHNVGHSDRLPQGRLSM